MAVWKYRSKRKASGGRYHQSRKKRSCELGKVPIFTRVSEKTVRTKQRARGGNVVNVLITAAEANLNIGNNKFKKTKIISVRENISNRHFVRMNVVSKGAIIETQDGLAKVTNRPTRDGLVNAMLIKSK